MSARNTPAPPASPALPPALEEFFTRTAHAGSASSRERHAWIRREVANALALPQFPPVRRVEELFTTANLQLLWDLGCTDRLRTRSPGRRHQEGPQSPSTMLARWSALKRLLDASGCAASMPRRPNPAAWPHPAQPGQGPQLQDQLSARAGRRLAAPDPKLVRMHAIVGLILDTGARTAELHALTWNDFTPGLASVRIVRYPPGVAPTSPALVELYALSTRTRQALEQWKSERDVLAGQIQGSDEGKVWVTLSSSHSGPPGRSLALGGLARSYNTVRDLLEAWTGTQLPEHLKDLSLAAAAHAVPLSSHPLTSHPSHPVTSHPLDPVLTPTET